MLLFDLLSGYYYRRLQLEVAPHVCKMGYCRASWNDKCRLNLPWPDFVETMYQDDTLGRMIPRRANLLDDAYAKTVSLELLVRSGMNVQINQHHPMDTNRGLLYSINYETKPEPRTGMTVKNCSDDFVIQYFKGQFVALAAAAKAVSVMGC